MNTRSILIYLLEITALIRKFRYDFAREIVVTISSAILILLFFYMFNDFLNIEVAKISTAMRNSFAEHLSILALIMVTGFCGHLLRKAKQDHNYMKSFLKRTGETDTTIYLYAFIKGFSILLLGYGAYWALVTKYLISWSLVTSLGLQLLSFLFLIVIYFYPNHEKETDPNKESHNDRIFPSKTTGSKNKALLVWRLRQLLLRNRLGQLCLLFTLLFSTITLFSSQNRDLFIAPAFLSYCASLLIASAISFQISEDIKYAWAERSMGISHDSIVRAYFVMALVLGGGFGLLNSIFYLLGNGVLELTTLVNAAKIFFVTALCPLSIPTLMFQIDPRRSFIQIISALIIGVMLATAIYASIFSVILLPFLKYYGDQYQQGRFYRA